MDVAEGERVDLLNFFFSLSPPYVRNMNFHTLLRGYIVLSYASLACKLHKCCSFFFVFFLDASSYFMACFTATRKKRFLWTSSMKD